LDVCEADPSPIQLPQSGGDEAIKACDLEVVGPINTEDLQGSQGIKAIGDRYFNGSIGIVG
jgi:hypothetical protein